MASLTFGEVKLLHAVLGQAIRNARGGGLKELYGVDLDKAESTLWIMENTLLDAKFSEILTDISAGEEIDGL